jgi:hypothetical protein
MQHNLSPMRSARNTVGISQLRGNLRRSVFVGFLLLACVSGYSAFAQSTSQSPISAPPHPSSILLPEANHLPDVNDRMIMNETQKKRQNFDAANTLRQKQIDDETVKLLILAKDLKEEMDRLGDKPLPDKLMREAEVIELLAHDVQKKMTLIVKGS